MDAHQIALNARRASSSPLTIIGHWRRRKAASALLADGGFAAMQALIAALGPPGSKSWSGAERNWLVQEIARRASPEAREAVCTHFLTHTDNEFGAMLAAWGHEPEDAARQALLFFLTSQWQRYEEIDPDHSLLRTAYETADPALRIRLVEQASRHGRLEWIGLAIGGMSGDWLPCTTAVTKVISALHEHPTELWKHLDADAIPILLKILEEYRKRQIIHYYNDWLRYALQLARRAYQALAELEREEDRAVVCEHFLHHADPELGAILIAWEYAPKEAASRALLFLSTGQWQRYETDLNDILLQTVYESADPALRGRLMEEAGRHGRQEWVGVVVGDLSSERLSRMNGAEWQGVVDALSKNENRAELWRIAQEAPPFWAKRLVDPLGDWPLQQVGEADRPLLSALLRAAAACPLSVYDWPIYSQIIWIPRWQSLAWVPVGAYDARSRTSLSWQLQDQQVRPDERRWMEFIDALLRWRGRHDIGIADTPAEGPGEFDIELGSETSSTQRGET